MNVQIKELSPNEDNELTAFLDELAQRSPSVLAYHYPFYRDMLCALDVGTPYYLAARREGRLVGVLSAFRREAAEGVVFSSLSYFGPNAGVLCGPDDEDQVHAALIGALLETARAERALSVSIYTPLLFDRFELYDAFKPDAVVERFTQWTTIDCGPWNSSIRYDLRRAQREGLEIERELTTQRFDEFYDIYRENCQSREIPLKPKPGLARLVASGVLGRYSAISFAMLAGRMVGGLLVLFTPATCSYYVPCLRDDVRALQPGSALIDDAITQMRMRNVRTWNWESSPGRDSGVYKFKAKWHAAESGFRVYVWCPAGVDRLRTLGRDRLAAAFPYFFVYPYDRL